jgi:hypothetical protein
MESRLGSQERRSSARLRMIYPAIYTRYDDKGRVCDEKPSRSINVSMGGVRLQSSFPINPREVIDVFVAVADNLVSFKGEVIYVTDSQGQGFELGISIKEIKNDDRIALDGYQLRREGPSEIDRDQMIIRMGQILCPNCGRQIARVAEIKDMINSCKEFFSMCPCGQRYDIKISPSGCVSLSFPDKQIELIC